MKTYPIEIARFERYLGLHRQVEVSYEQERGLQKYAQMQREWAKKHPLSHFALQLLPFMVLGLAMALVWILIKQHRPEGLVLLIIYGLFRGIWGYSFVVYALHEGAGHQLFNGHALLSRIAFHSSRLFFADPEYYRQRHIKHHLYLGSKEDGAFTHYVQTSRVVKSLLPLFGTIIPHDYVIYKGDELTPSLVVSTLIGSTFLAGEVFFLYHFSNWSLVSILITLLVFAPWVGIVLERIRESVEHHLMPQDNRWGSRELGLSWWALLIGGGPWGQPCHLSHHLAGDLNWYQQIRLHHELMKTMTPEQKAFFVPKSFLSMVTNWFRTQSEVEHDEMA